MASCTRLSPKSRWPAAIRASISSALRVLLTATSWTSPASRLATFAADSMPSRMRFRRSGTLLIEARYRKRDGHSPAIMAADLADDRRTHGRWLVGRDRPDARGSGGRCAALLAGRGRSGRAGGAHRADRQEVR